MSQTSQVFMEDLRVFLDAFIWVPIRVNTDENALDVEVLSFFRIPYFIQRLRHFDQTDWADVGAVCEPEIDHVILASKVLVSDRLAFRVVEEPRSSNISFTGVSCWR